MTACRSCRLPATLRARVADDSRRGVPLRSTADFLREAGHAVSKDAIYRHCRDHLAPADTFDVEHDPEADRSAGLTVAVVAARHLAQWPSLSGRIAEALRSEALPEAAAVIDAGTPDTMRAALVAAAGSPASEIMESRLLAKAMRQTFGAGFPDAARDLADTLRQLGGDDLADALTELADSVEANRPPENQDRPAPAASAAPERARAPDTAPAEVDHEAQLRALRATRNVGDAEERKRVLAAYLRLYGKPSESLVREAVYGT